MVHAGAAVKSRGSSVYLLVASVMGDARISTRQMRLRKMSWPSKADTRLQYINTAHFVLLYLQ